MGGKGTGNETGVRAREELIATLRAFFASRPGVRMAFLFGSSARGRHRRDSDLDVAVLFEPDAHR